MTFGDGDEIKCTIDCCDPTVPGGCVHTPSDDDCMILDDECNVGICGLTGNCEIEELTGDPCGDPSSCTSGVCVAGSNNRATCQITNTCTAPDTCSTASCDGAGKCTISSRCICPEFCNNAIPTGSCLQCDQTHPCPDDLVCDAGIWVGCKHDRDCKGGDSCTIASCIDSKCHFKPDPDCEDECEDRHGGSSRSGGFGGGVVTIPVPVATPVVAPAPAVVPVPGVMSPVSNNPNGDRPDAADPISGGLSGGVKDAPRGSNDKDSETSSSCATIGTDIKDLWMWMVILAAIYSIRRRKQAQAKSAS